MLLLMQVEVGHDGEGSHAAWHLAWVRVTNLDTGESATFQCNRWPLDAVLCCAVLCCAVLSHVQSKQKSALSPCADPPAAQLSKAAYSMIYCFC